MASPGRSRPGNVPPKNNPNSLDDNTQSLQISGPHQPSTTASTNPAPFCQQPPPFAGGQPVSCPGPPAAGVFPRGQLAAIGSPQSTLPSDVGLNRPTGPPHVSQAPPPFASRPPHLGYAPPVAGSTVPPPPGGIAPSGQGPLLGALRSGPTFPPSSTASLMSTGPPAFGSGSVEVGPCAPPTSTAPRFPAAGPPQTMYSCALEPPSIRSPFGSLPATAPGGMAQPAPPIVAAQPSVLPPSGSSPFAQQSQVMLPPSVFPLAMQGWQVQSGQVLDAHDVSTSATSAKSKSSGNRQIKAAESTRSEGRSGSIDNEDDEQHKMTSSGITVRRLEAEEFDREKEHKRPEKKTDVAVKRQTKLGKRHLEESSDAENEGDVSEDGESQPAQKSVKKEETSTPKLGKHIEHLKSVTKGCGMSIAATVCKKTKQVPDSKREDILTKDLDDILTKEGLSKNPSENGERMESTEELKGENEERHLRNLPPEMMDNILKRLSIACVLRFKAVSRSWGHYLSSLEFIRENSEMQAVKLLLYGNRRFKVGDLEPLFGIGPAQFVDLNQNGTLEIIDSAAGLICLVNWDSRDIDIWNPSMRKIVKLPRIYLPDGNFLLPLHDIDGFGFAVLNGDFYVAVVSNFILKPYLHRKLRSRIILFTRSTNGWNELPEVDALLKNPTPTLRSAVFLNHNWYWLSTWFEDSNRKKTITKVFSLDLMDNTYSCLEIPLIDVGCQMSLLGVGQEIGLFCLYTTRIDLWRFTFGNSWHRITLDHNFGPVRRLRSLFFQGGKLLLLVGSHIYVADLRDGRIELPLLENAGVIDDAITYRPSCLSPILLNPV